jgi:hypothetical protein
MSKKIQNENLVIGKRYYFDVEEKANGIFDGVDKSRNALVFADVKENDSYLPEPDGSVCFDNVDQSWWEYEN